MCFNNLIRISGKYKRKQILHLSAYHLCLNQKCTFATHNFSEMLIDDYKHNPNCMHAHMLMCTNIYTYTHANINTRSMCKPLLTSNITAHNCSYNFLVKNKNKNCAKAYN